MAEQTDCSIGKIGGVGWTGKLIAYNADRLAPISALDQALHKTVPPCSKDRAGTNHQGAGSEGGLLARKFAGAVDTQWMGGVFLAIRLMRYAIEHEVRAEVQQQATGKPSFGGKLCDGMMIDGFGPLWIFFTGVNVSTGGAIDQYCWAMARKN